MNHAPGTVLIASQRVHPTGHEDRDGLCFRQWLAGIVLAGLASDPMDREPAEAARIALKWTDALIAALASERVPQLPEATWPLT